MSRTMLKRLVAIIAGTLAGLSPTFADPVADFYRGSTIRLHVSASVGGGYDHVARLFIKYFPQYLPGRPNMIVVNAPGAAGVVMSNSLYNVAPKDGTVLGMANLTMPMNQVITPAQVRYDANKFHWLGNLEESNGSIFTWHTSPTKTFQDALKRETIMGVSSRASVLYQLLVLSNRLLGSKFKVILGYEGNRVISIERGEIEGSASNLENFAGIAPHWMKDKQVNPGLINILIVNSPQRIPRYPDVPTMMRDDRQSRVQENAGVHDAAVGDLARDLHAARRAGGAGRGAAPRLRPDRPRSRLRCRDGALDVRDGAVHRRTDAGRCRAASLHLARHRGQAAWKRSNSDVRPFAFRRQSWSDRSGASSPAMTTAASRLRSATARRPTCALIRRGRASP